MLAGVQAGYECWSSTGDHFKIKQFRVYIYYVYGNEAMNIVWGVLNGK